jgi:tetratricopeptide (TPR) repeat protein
MRHPSDDELWGDLGDMLMYDGRIPEARQAYLRAFRIDPYDSEWHDGLMNVGGSEEVLEIMRDTVVDSDDESLGDLADLLYSMGYSDEACQYYRQAAEIDPYDSEWIEHATECGFEPPDDYDTYGASDTGYTRYYDEIGYVDSYEGMPSADDIPGLVERVNNDANLLVRLGQAYLKADDRDKATETLWGALLVAPTDEEALQSYLVAAGKTRREVLEKLRDTFPDDDEVVGILADHYLDLGLRDRARDLYALANSLDEDDPEWKAKKELLESAR